MPESSESKQSGPPAVAVIGMACRFPGARDADAFWRNVRDGVESIRELSADELVADGLDPARLDDPDLVKMGALLEDIDLFDAGFFGLTPREAALMDPQHRLFLECAWTALENAGYDPARYQGAIGVYGGGAFGSYLINNVLPSGALSDPADVLPILLSNEQDFLATAVAYKLDLRGPAFTIQSACSTSLVAAHVACQSLLNFETDMALAGGVAVDVTRGRGYYHQHGGITSPDGHCRAFDAHAQGTIFGQGVGIVALKRLDDALAEGDFIHAVILGSAINNDGSLKVGFTAPSVQGQAAVIAEALANGDVAPQTIGYVEAHGTGTALGDPIEVQALAQAFGQASQNRQFCGIGSVKSNIGHADAAAGVAGLIKAVQALEHRTLPATLNVDQPNPAIPLEKTPFYVVTQATAWPAGRTPRRAGVSSFGLGGTNAHLVLEQAPPRPEPAASRSHHLLNLSARTPQALNQAAQNLATHLERHPQLNLADVAYTLNVGRAAFSRRLSVSCADTLQAPAALRQAGIEAGSSLANSALGSKRDEVTFLFPGHGAQSLNMGRELYEREPVFRREVDRVSELARNTLDTDLQDILYPASEQDGQAAARLNRTDYGQVAVFAVDYALARLWMHWGVHPTALIGYSVGELVAACVARVFALEDAVRFVARRGQLMHVLPAGAMTAVVAAADQLKPYLADGVEIGAVNAPNVSILCGPVDAVATVERKLLQRGIDYIRVPAAQAFHSSMLDPVVDPTRKLLDSITLGAPEIPILSTITGDWLDKGEAADPQYWATHARRPVRFGASVARLMKEKPSLLVEVGPGQSLATLVRQQLDPNSWSQRMITSLPDPRSAASQQGVLVDALGHLWQAGVSVDWKRYYEDERRCRVPLPTYPFQRERHWVEPMPQTSYWLALAERQELADKFFLPTWMRSATKRHTADAGRVAGCCVILDDGSSLGRTLAREMQQRGLDVVTVQPGDSFRHLDGASYTVDPGNVDGYRRLASELRQRNSIVALVIHLWALPCVDAASHQKDPTTRLDRGFFALLHLTQSLAERSMESPLRLGVVTSQVFDVLGQEALDPEKATVVGPCRVIPHELPHISCCHLDVEPNAAVDPPDRLVSELTAELLAETATPLVAYRRGQRWVPATEPVRFPPSEVHRLKTGGVYLITGGLGGMGLVLAEYLAAHWAAKLVLTGRHGLPTRADWHHLEGGEDKVARQIRIVERMEAQGAEVMVRQADVCDEDQMQKVVDETRARFGRLDGVIHAAGVAGAGLIQLKTREEALRVLAPKVLGTQTLGRVLADSELDFLVLCSSLTSLYGGMGQVDYCAANAYLDAFAHDFRRRTGIHTVAINWNAWREAGMAVETKLPESLEATMRQWLMANSINNKDGADAFGRILAYCYEPQVAVSSLDLQLLSRPAYARMGRSVAEHLHDAHPAAGTSKLHARPDLPTPYVAPGNEIEQTIAGVWQQLFGIDRLGIHDDFLALGGHSLLAAQVIAHLRNALQVEIPMRDLFESPTIAGLANLVESVRSRPDDDATRIPRASRDGPLPLSFFQERQFFLSQMKPDSAADNLFVPLYGKGELNIAVLEASFQEVCRRHESMRTSIAVADAQPRQVICDQLSWRLPVVDLRGLRAQQRAVELRHLLRAEATRPFDLARPPLWRATIVQVDNRDFFLLFNIHHIISDGWSLGVLGRELSEIYRARCEDRAPQLPDLPVQYGDFAVWQRQWLQGDVLSKQLSFWRKTLADVPVLNLPTDSPRPARQTFAGGMEPVEFSAELSDAVKGLGQTENASPFMTLLAAFVSLLSLYSGQTDIPVGTFATNRSREEFEPLIGFFINNLVLRCDASGNPTFRELLARVREVTLQAYAHQELPFEKLLQELRVDRDPSRTPLFQVMLVFQNFPATALELPGTALHGWSTHESDQETRSNFDLTLWIGESDERLMGYVDFNSDLFRPDTIRRLLSHYKELLELVVADPDRPIGEYPGLSNQERDQFRASAVNLREAVAEPQYAGGHRVQPATNARAGPAASDLELRRQKLAARRRALTSAQLALLERRLRGSDRDSGEKTD